jgi:TonB family protein
VELMETSEDAQRILEQKALRNVRALVDKFEAEGRDRPMSARAFALWFLPIGVVAVLVGVVAMRGLWEWRTRHEPVPPANASEYVDQLLTKIEKRGTRAQRRDIENLEGRVEVTFVIKPSGYVDNLQVSRSSLDSVIDRESLTLVKGSQPYGRLTPDAGDALKVKATLQYGSHANGRGSFRITGTPGR